jgi:type I restriction enzyme S subunit
MTHGVTQWKEIRLGDHLSFLTSGSRDWSKYYARDGALFLRIQNIGYNELRLEDIVFVQPPDGAEARRTRVQPGDLLLSSTADRAYCCCTKGLGTAHINQHRNPTRQEIDPHYLAAFLSLSLDGCS